MGFTKKIWKDRISEFPARRNLTKENGDTELVTVARSEGSISQEGDAFSAENMNGLEERIGSGFDEVNSNLQWKFIGSVTGTSKTISVDFSKYAEIWVQVSFMLPNGTQRYFFAETIPTNFFRTYGMDDVPVYWVIGGHYTMNTYGSDAVIKITKNKLQLYGTSVNTTSYASSAVFELSAR